MCGRLERNTREKREGVYCKLFVFVSFCSRNKTLCFIPSECFKATTSGFSHPQLVSEPRSSENRGIFRDSRIFKVVKNKSSSIRTHCRKNQLNRTPGWTTRAAWIFGTVWPRAAHAPWGRRRLSHTRSIFEPLSRAEPSRKLSLKPSRRIFPRIFPFQVEPLSRAARRRSRADRIFHRIFPVQPSEPPAVQNWFFDRFTHLGPDFYKVRPVPDYFDHSGSIYSVRLAKFNSQKVI